MDKIAILGATGPTGIHLAAVLRAGGAAVRVVARNAGKLARLFPDPAIERHPADILQPDATLRAIEGCDLVYDCIGLPGNLMHLHGATARNIATALKETGARCVQVSSYWSYYPQVRADMDETHPRVDGSPWMRHRREAEDILSTTGAAILHLPDFYGPDVHTGTLQNALQEAAARKTINWIGSPRIAREYIYVPDAMRIAAEIGRHEGAFGTHWCLPGSGALTGRQVADIASRRLGRKIKLRAAGMLMLRAVALLRKDLRGFLQVVPEYMKPVHYDIGKLEELLGRQAMTPYETGISATLDWLAERGTK